jgi:hypothetical protein
MLDSVTTHFACVAIVLNIYVCRELGSSGLHRRLDGLILCIRCEPSEHAFGICTLYGLLMQLCVHELKARTSVVEVRKQGGCLASLIDRGSF